MSTYGPRQHYKIICEGPGGGEEPDTVAIEFQNNAVVEENNFTDLGKRKKTGKTADALRNT